MLDGEEWEAETGEPGEPGERTCDDCGRTLLDYEVRVGGRCVDCDARHADELRDADQRAQEVWRQEHEQQAWERWREWEQQQTPTMREELAEPTFDWLTRLAREVEELRQRHNSKHAPDTPEPLQFGGHQVFLNPMPPYLGSGNESTPGGRVSKPKEPNIPNDPAPYRPVDFPNPRIYARLEFLKWRIRQGLLDDDRNVGM